MGVVKFAFLVIGTFYQWRGMYLWGRGEADTAHKFLAVLGIAECLALCAAMSFGARLTW
jgi:hypothetical protein